MFSRNFYYRIKYQLIKKAPFQVFLNFIIDRIKHPFIKSQKKLYRNLHQNYLKNKYTTTDYFSINTYYWHKIISKNFKKFSYLEIGSWEGNSALFILKNYNTVNVVCVDFWEKNNEINENFENFKLNMEEYKNRFSFFREMSDNFFINNKEKFDVIYIDGSHEPMQVYKDINNAWNFLNISGILICDDYFYGNIYTKSNNVPADAINKFIKEKNNLEIICVNNSQIFLKKVK
jgi:predicted O-methyltransferase YrrM|tara:strand:- start:245 stop:940 length:696 start_codon:yes stop_codon:yes gene_type:complete